MKRALLLLALAGSPAVARESLGIFDSWGAFTDASPRRCFAIAEPVPELEPPGDFFRL